MAERRMFAKTVVESDAFLELPPSAQAVYFHLGMAADDDGFVNNPIRVTRMAGANKSDLDLLIEKRFILRFDSGVVVVKHWLLNNYIQKDRYKPSVYQEEKALLTVKDNNVYSLDTKCIQSVSKTDTQVSIGEVSIVKDSIERGKFTPPTPDEVRLFCQSKGYQIDVERFIDFYTSKGWMIGKNRMKDWRAAVRNWARRDREEKPKTQNYKSGFYNDERIAEIERTLANRS